MGREEDAGREEDVGGKEDSRPGDRHAARTTGTTGSSCRGITVGRRGTRGAEKGGFANGRICRPVAAGVCSVVEKRDCGQGPRILLV